jgi:type III pantothenate kinase
VLLTIDIGNTETKLGCFDGERLEHTWRVTTESRRTADEYGVFFTQLFATASLPRERIEAIAVASVVPRLDHTVRDACESYFRVTPHFLDPATQTVLNVLTDRPSETGADLVAAVIGAVDLYGAPLIVASFGTATVFMAVSPEGAFIGAAIAPGINISIDALVSRTAKLPQVSLEAPERAIGRNTVDALRSGLIHGFVGQSEAIVARMRDEMQASVRVIATGGLAGVVARHSSIIDTIDPYLTLYGLRLFYRSLR